MDRHWPKVEREGGRSGNFDELIRHGNYKFRRIKRVVVHTMDIGGKFFIELA